jgi:hypothetical protein
MQGVPFPDAGIAVQLAAPLAHRSDDQRAAHLEWGTVVHRRRSQVVVWLALV